jgi:divalent metal cation (Fe/Co/Zn/Cd) transporter
MKQTNHPDMSGSEKAYKKALFLEYFTVIYNIVEAALSIFFGSMAKSIALVGFGLDSVVESLSGGVMIWRLHKHGKISEKDEASVEKKAQKFVAATFFILGVYVFVQSVKKLILKEIPDPSFPGIVIATVSLIVMPLLSLQKLRTGKTIHSEALIADSKETLACALLSSALLLGLGLNYLFSFWQADALVGLVIVVYLFKEGCEVWKESMESE